MLTVYPKCKYLVVVSLYDTKPVYLLLNACENIQWTKKERKNCGIMKKGKKVDALFYRLNQIDEYNMGMGNVYQEDRLRLQYRVHYWSRNQKRWFAIFFGVL